jgi:anaerobic sulfite reductase subunit C
LEPDELKVIKKICVIVQKQDDLFVIRLKAVAGDLDSGQMVAVAKAASRYADGMVHISTRQGLEIHNVTGAQVEPALIYLLGHGVLYGASGPRARAIMACPGSGTCPNGIVETKGLARVLDEKYFAAEAPGKIKIAISGCPNSCTKTVINDVGITGAVLPVWEQKSCKDCGICEKSCPGQAITRQPDGTYQHQEALCLLCGTCINKCPESSWKPGITGYNLYLGGTMGKKPRLGNRVKTLIRTQTELFTYLDRVLAYYRQYGCKKERFGHMMDRLGVDEVIREITE